MTFQNDGISANMQKKLRRQGTQARPATVNNEGAHGAEVAGVWVWGPTVIETKMVKIGHFHHWPDGDSNLGLRGKQERVEPLS